MLARVCVWEGHMGKLKLTPWFGVVDRVELLLELFASVTCSFDIPFKFQSKSTSFHLIVLLWLGSWNTFQLFSGQFKVRDNVQGQHQKICVNWFWRQGNILILSVDDFSVLYPSLCLQSTDDEVFAKRHMKQELEEKRRKR